MTREEILHRREQLAQEWMELSNRWKANGYIRSKADKKRQWEIIKEDNDLHRELDKLDGKTFTSDKWITKYIGNSYESLKAARFDLINQIKAIAGVEIGDDKTGVVGVTVRTEYKEYHFVIHAHYRVEIVREWKEQGMFGEVTRQETKNIYQAWCEPAGYPNWNWRY